MTRPERSQELTWRELLEEQDLVLARTQALATGMSEDAWQWRIETGRWTRLVPGVAVAHSGDASSRQRAWGAVLHAGRGAALTGEVALVEQGFRSSWPSRDLDVAVPEERVVRAVPIATHDVVTRVVPHRVRGLDAWRHLGRRPAVLRVAPAVLHAAAFASTDRAAEWRIAAVVQQRLATPQQISEALQGMPRLRRHALISRVIADVDQGVQAQSELDFLRLLRRHRLPVPDRLQRLVRAGGKRYLDAWWERQRVAAEIDGAHHLEVGQWSADVMRSNDVVVAERHDRLLLLRFTTGNLRHDEAAVIGQLRRALC